MFVAWRELRFARGRFLLIAAVVALITLLVGFLSGLTGGLASQNVSSLLQLPADRLVLQQTDGLASFSASSLDAGTVEAWESAAGVESVTPIGISQARAELTGTVGSQSGQVGVAVFGFFEAPSGAEDRDASTATELSVPLSLSPAEDGQVGLSAGAAKELGAEVGDTVSITGEQFTVATIGGDSWYSHTPVVALTEHDWEAASQRVGGSGEPTVLAVSGGSTADADWEGVAASTGTVAETPLMSLTALEAFKSEIGSLGLMIAMLFGISALVVGAFFTVWTMQRAGDIAVLKALGAATPSLVRDSLGQALVVLALGIGTGLAVVVGLGLLAANVLPFMLSPLTTIAPAVVMAILGLAGAAFALRSVTKADPLTALGSHR